MLHQSASHVVGTITIQYRIDMTTSSLASSISHQRRHSSSEKRNGMPRWFALSRCAPAFGRWGRSASLRRFRPVVTIAGFVATSGFRSSLAGG